MSSRVCVCVCVCTCSLRVPTNDIQLTSSFFERGIKEASLPSPFAWGRKRPRSWERPYSHTIRRVGN